jgi:hypothetical protein
MDGEKNPPVCVNCGHVPRLARIHSTSSPLNPDPASNDQYGDYRKTSGTSDQIPSQLLLVKLAKKPHARFKIRHTNKTKQLLKYLIITRYHRLLKTIRTIPY